mmetsp:Transcript_879/g.2215  ORF Transcript_879/g.2215 Transcript_879/m.2215 type:complete len:87 (-) Transcript_879:18-278(-)
MFGIENICSIDRDRGQSIFHVTIADTRIFRKWMILAAKTILLSNSNLTLRIADTNDMTSPIDPRSHSKKRRKRERHRFQPRPSIDI